MIINKSFSEMNTQAHKQTCQYSSLYKAFLDCADKI